MQHKHSFSISSIIRRNRKNGEGEVPVYLRITCNGRRTEVSINIFIDPIKWQPAKGRVKGVTEETRRLNHCIEVFEHRARKIYNRHILTGNALDIHNIKKELVGQGEDQRYLVREFQFLVHEIEKTVGRNYSAGTIKNWKVTLGHLKEFLKVSYASADVSFANLDMAFLHMFEIFAAVQWKCGTNATLKHIERIRKIVNKAVSVDWIEKDPFDSFQGKQEKTHRTFLT